jgi:hypothetical protein
MDICDDTIKMGVKERGWKSEGVNLSGSGQGLMTGSCELGNEPSDPCFRSFIFF